MEGMTKPTLFTLVILLFGLAPLAQAAPPDRCAKLDRTGYPIACDPIGWRDAPYWNDTVCCNTDTCVETNARGGCSTDKKLYYCEFAELDAVGLVTCLFGVPYYCEEYECPSSSTVQVPLQEQVVCCEHGGPCWPYNQSTDGGCLGQILNCTEGTCNDDGTITCYNSHLPD
jgi:hypothetical protein